MRGFVYGRKLRLVADWSSLPRCQFSMNFNLARSTTHQGESILILNQKLGVRSASYLGESYFDPDSTEEAESFFCPSSSSFQTCTLTYPSFC